MMIKESLEMSQLCYSDCTFVFFDRYLYYICFFKDLRNKIPRDKIKHKIAASYQQFQFILYLIKS